MTGGSERLGLALVAAVACTSAPPTAPAEPSPSGRAVEPAASTGAEPETKRHAKGTTTKRDGSGRCDPEPKSGEPCAEGDSWCVLSWGEPGGHSSALWCRGGRWEREEEVNLPADEG